jgi:hypothetical protein
MVRASSGQMPQGKTMTARRIRREMYRPGIESLERKQLLSTGLLSGVATALATPVPALVIAQPHRGVTPDGTGKGIIIITS